MSGEPVKAGSPSPAAQPGIDAIRAACVKLGANRREEAAAVIRREYPFTPIERQSRTYPLTKQMQVFRRDGFVDRYSGRRLVFPGVLRLLAKELPDVVPYHPNWAMEKTHQAFWELFPTIDHVVPIARGGTNDLENLVCTSQIMNSAKANWSLEELNWRMHPPGDIDAWDGLTAWFLDYTAARPEVLEGDNYLTGWHRAARGPARRARSDARARSGPSTSIRSAAQVRRAAEGLGVTVFALDGDASAEAGFAHWRAAEKNAYFVTESKNGYWMIHRPSCSSLTFGVDWKLTSRPKACAARLDDLREFAKRLGVELKGCSRCRSG